MDLGPYLTFKTSDFLQVKDASEYKWVTIKDLS